MSFEETVNGILESLTDELTTLFAASKEGNPGNCAQDKIISQSAQLYVGPGFKGPTCNINLTQNAVINNSDPICVDINSNLISMSEADKTDIITRSLAKIYEKLPLSVRENTDFLSGLKNRIIELMVGMNTDITASCSQTIHVTQNKTIMLLGEIKCENTTFDFSQTALINQYMKCIVSPMLDEVKKDPFLKLVYSRKPNRNCIYEKKYIQPCSQTNRTRSYKIKILSPQVGSGTCNYTDNQIITEMCEPLVECEVSPWTEWGPCINSTHTRTRTIVKPGTSCPTDFSETEACEEPVRPTVGEEQPSKPMEIQDYEWFFYGPDRMSSTQKIVLYIFMGFLGCLYLYVLLF